jgi:D-lactate dehydrogenase (cytochrome)
VQRDIEQAQEIANQERCQAWAFERDEAARERLWDARHAAALAIIATAPTKGPMTTDVCVPIAELPGALRHARQTVAAHDLEGAILGHVGDGNYHTVFMVDPHDPAEVERAERVNAEIVRYGLSRGGTCTGEHGVGFGKIGYLAAEHGDALPLMRTIKQAMDPNDILNPGKLFA